MDWSGFKTKFHTNNTRAAFQFTETYKGPGLSNHTIIQRTTEVTAVTDTTSIFCSNYKWIVPPPKLWAETIGGVSAMQSRRNVWQCYEPIIQVLQGPYITNTYGEGSNVKVPQETLPRMSQQLLAMSSMNHIT